VQSTSDEPATAWLDIAAALNRTDRRGAVLACSSTDLNVNVVVIDASAPIAAHTNQEVDVLIVGLAGSGVVAVNDEEFAIGEQQALLIPKGASRAIRSTEERLAYLTCHRRRAGIRPAVAGRDTSV
jgi:mannose-6-phosphate isomerase-like protein (cupin superfamily)